MQLSRQLARSILALTASTGCPYASAQAQDGVLNITSQGEVPAHVLIDDKFAGFAPATIQLPAGVHKISVQYGTWGDGATIYDISVKSDAAKVEVQKSTVDLQSENCLQRDPSQRNTAMEWTSKVEAIKYLPLTIDVPGYVHIVRGCPQSPWFGTDKYYDLTVATSPPGADIKIEGVSYGKSPVHVKIKHTFMPSRLNELRVSATKTGYLTAADVLRASGSAEINLSLVPIK